MNKWWIVGGIVAVLALAFAYYAVAPLFTVLEADDALPVSAEVTELSVLRIVDTPAHPASGTVRIVEADGKTYVRYEDYETINGPDIYVYLAKDLDANEFVNLGRVKGTMGNVNYEVPAGVDVSQYRYVLTWCKTFGVLFNYAEIGQ